MSRQIKPCPICGKPSLHQHRPFCSPRCKNIDLGRWLGEQYAIPAEDPPDFADDEDETPPRLH